MAVDIQIEGTSYLAGASAGQYLIEAESVSVDLDVAAQQPSAEFDLTIWGKAIAIPRAGMEVVMYAANGSREFGGILQQIDETEIEPTVMQYHCKCSDYTPWYDRHLVRGVYQSMDADAVVKSIVSQYVNTPGNTKTFTTNNVQPSYPVPLQQFVYVPPSQVMAQLVQMLGWGWYIDSYRDVHFYSMQSFGSPLPGNLLDADDLYNDPTQAGGTGQGVYPDWINLTIAEDASQVKNRCFVTGIYVAQQAKYTEEKIGDGVTTTFVLGYQAPDDTSIIYVTVGGTPYQIGLDLIDSQPGGPCEALVAYVNFTQQTVRFCTPPASGVTIVFTYYPMTQTAAMQQNIPAQQYMASIDGTDGIYEYNRLDPALSAETPVLANQRAKMTLTKYAYPYTTMTFESYLQGWFPGQSFSFSSARRWGGLYQVANGTQKAMFVTRVQKRIIQALSGGWTWKYTVDAANVPFDL